MRELIFVFLLTSAITTKAQTTFQREVPPLSGIQKTNDGGFIGFGVQPSAMDTSGDVVLIKYDSLYGISWTSSFGRQGADGFSHLLQLQDSSYMAGGFFCCTPGQSFDYNLYKIDKTGVPIWLKNYGTTFQESVYAMCASIQGGVILAGTTASNLGGGYIINVDANGTVLWSKIYRFGSFGNGTAIRAIKRTTDNGYIMLGDGALQQSIFLLKADSMGSVVWARAFYAPENIWANSIDVTAKHGFILGCHADLAGTFGQDYLLVCTDSMGAIIWSYVYGSTDDESVPEVVKTEDDAFLATSFSYGFGVQNSLPHGYALKVDTGGTVLWSKAYGDSVISILSAAIDANDGGYLYVNSFTNHILIKTDALGNSGCLEYVVVPHRQAYPMTATTLSPLLFASAVSTTDTLHTSGFTFTHHVYCIDVGMADPREDAAVFIFPNPSYDIVKIKTVKQLHNAIFYLYDVYGNSCIRSELNAEETIVHTNELANGIYFYQILHSGNPIKTGKLIFQ